MHMGTSSLPIILLSLYRAVMQTIQIYVLHESMILSNEYEIMNIFNLIRATLVALQQFTRLLEHKVWLFSLLQ